jgi:hypothetical protein
MRKTKIKKDSGGYTVVVYDRELGRWFEVDGPFRFRTAAQSVIKIMRYADRKESNR